MGKVADAISDVESDMQQVVKNFTNEKWPQFDRSVKLYKNSCSVFTMRVESWIKNGQKTSWFKKVSTKVKKINTLKAKIKKFNNEVLPDMLWVYNNAKRGEE